MNVDKPAGKNKEQGRYQTRVCLHIRYTIKSMLLSIESLLCRPFLAIVCEYDVIHKTGSAQGFYIYLS